jgi:hypothetical protein
MAYTDPDTGITRDKYGKEVRRDPSGGDPRSGASFLAWVVGIVITAALILMLFNVAGPRDRRAAEPDEQPITEPLNKAPPPATP